MDTNAPEWSIASDPADGDDGVDRQRRIIIELGRSPLPSSVTRSNLSLRSGQIDYWLDFRLQPLHRELWITARGALEPDTTYALEVRGLVDLDGVARPEPYRALFRTGRELGHLEPEPAIDAQAVLALLESRCGRATCHASDESAAGLNLATAAGIETTARNMGTQRSMNVRGLPPRGSLFLAAPLIIAANPMRGEPERSYLVYKLMGDEHIVGARMPPNSEDALSESEIQLVIDWIYVGAPTQ